MTTEFNSFDASPLGAFKASQFADARNRALVPRGRLHVAICSWAGPVYTSAILSSIPGYGTPRWDRDVILWGEEVARGAMAIFCRIPWTYDLGPTDAQPGPLIPADRVLPPGITLVEKNVPNSPHDFDDLLSLAQSMVPPPEGPPLDAWSGGAYFPVFLDNITQDVGFPPFQVEPLVAEWMRGDDFQNLFSAPTILRPSAAFDGYRPFFAGDLTSSVLLSPTLNDAYRRGWLESLVLASRATQST